MAPIFGPSDHHLAILQKLKLRYMHCSHVVWDPIMLSYIKICVKY